MEVKNIFCVGRNYVLHAKELGNDVPEYPMIFSKPTHSLVVANDQIIEYPSQRGSLHYEVELVFRLGKDYEPGMVSVDCIDAMAVGIDFTLRDEQQMLKEKGHPWLRAKGFRNAAVISDFWNYEGDQQLVAKDFTLNINNQEVQRGNATDMIFDLDRLLSYCYTYFGLSKGDLIFTGTPQGVGNVTPGDLFDLFWGGDKKGRFTVSFY